MLAMNYHAMTMTGHDLPENVNVIGLISNGFNDPGVPPLLGRGLHWESGDFSGRHGARRGLDRFGRGPTEGGGAGAV